MSPCWLKLAPIEPRSSPDTVSILPEPGAALSKLTPEALSIPTSDEGCITDDLSKKIFMLSIGFFEIQVVHGVSLDLRPRQLRVDRA